MDAERLKELQDSFDFRVLHEWGREVENSPEPQWLIEDLVLRDAAVQVSGPATQGFKTWWSDAIALCAASGKPFGPLKPGAGPVNVLYFEKEGPRLATWNRWKWLAKGAGLDLERDIGSRLLFQHRGKLFLEDKGAIAELCEFVKLLDVKLVIFDTFAKSFHGDENSVRDITRAVINLDAIRSANPGCTVLWVHHVGKPTEHFRDIDSETRGSSALAGYYDIHIAMRRKPSDQQHIYMTLRSNEFEERYYLVTWSISKEAGTAMLEMDEVADFDAMGETEKDLYAAQLQSDAEYTRQALARAWNVTADKASEILEVLIDEGTMEQKGRKWQLR